MLREKTVSQEPEEPTLRVEPRRQGWSRFSVACRDGAGEGQGWPLAGVGFSYQGVTQRQIHIYPEPGRQARGHHSPLPSAALLRSPISLPPPRARPARAKRASAPWVRKPPQPSKPGGGHSSPQTAVETKSLRLCSSRARRQREGSGEGKLQVAARAQASPSPCWTQGQGHWSFFWLDRASIQETAWEKNLWFLSLRVKKTRNNHVGVRGDPGWRAGAGPPPCPGLRAQGNGKRAFLLWSQKKCHHSCLRTTVPQTKQGCPGALAMEMGLRDGAESSFPGAPLLGCWFCFSLKSRLL